MVKVKGAFRRRNRRVGMLPWRNFSGFRHRRQGQEIFHRPRKEGGKNTEAEKITRKKKKASKEVQPWTFR